MKITECTYCGVNCNNQPEGNGCHSCLRGYMVVKDNSNRYDPFVYYNKYYEIVVKNVDEMDED